MSPACVRADSLLLLTWGRSGRQGRPGKEGSPHPRCNKQRIRGEKREKSLHVGRACGWVTQTTRAPRPRGIWRGPARRLRLNFLAQTPSSEPSQRRPSLAPTRWASGKRVPNAAPAAGLWQSPQTARAPGLRGRAPGRARGVGSPPRPQGPPRPGPAADAPATPRRPQTLSEERGRAGPRSDSLPHRLHGERAPSPGGRVAAAEPGSGPGR